MRSEKQERNEKRNEGKRQPLQGVLQQRCLSNHTQNLTGEHQRRKAISIKLCSNFIEIAFLL